MLRDFYAELHVPAEANGDAIRMAFRAMARQCHPDHGGDAQRMQAISEAWAILSRPDRRAAYDKLRVAERLARQRPTHAKAVGQPTPTPDPAATPHGRDPNALDYGRYEGWTIEALANHDPDYLEWLRRSPGGRTWRTRIDVALAARAVRMPAPQAPAKHRGLFRRQAP
jgi:curved DNA-binding protein CbpA